MQPTKGVKKYSPGCAGDVALQVLVQMQKCASHKCPTEDRHSVFWVPKSLQMVTAAMKLKDTCS